MDLTHDFMFYSLIPFPFLRPPLAFFSRKGKKVKKMNEEHDRMVKYLSFHVRESGCKWAGKSKGFCFEGVRGMWMEDSPYTTDWIDGTEWSSQYKLFSLIFLPSLAFLLFSFFYFLLCFFHLTSLCCNAVCTNSVKIWLLFQVQRWNVPLKSFFFFNIKSLSWEKDFPQI